uniref:Putative neurobeachin homolog n=1 Tax=Steinernema glaseri TaxID=37863 RepID=A0A1I8AI95_9BILA
MSRSREPSETGSASEPTCVEDIASPSSSHPTELEINVDVDGSAPSPLPPLSTPLKTPDIDDNEMEDVMLNENAAEEPLDLQAEADSGACSEDLDNEVDQARADHPDKHSAVEEEKTDCAVIPEASQDEPAKEEEPEPEREPTSPVGLTEVRRNDSVDTLCNQMSRTTVIHSSEESAEETFRRLTNGIADGSLTQKDVVDGVFNVLVGGPFDLESRFIMESATNINSMLYFLDRVSPAIQAEIWSVFVAIARKSNRNLEACSRVGLITKVLDRLPLADNVISDFLVQLLGVLSNYSITVKETKRFLRALEAVDGVWLLQVMKEMSKRDGADVFFSFPGKAGAGIVLPPVARWPYQNGWAFCTWLRMDPLNSVNFEKEKPFLFYFKTSKNMGYSCYFMGNCLVVSAVNNRGKETTRCIRQELTPRKWHHIAISYVYSRWSKSEIQCFIDGQLCETIEMPWLASTNDYFNKCFIGCGPENDQNEAFCGQMAAIYVFSQAITLQQANCLYCLGATYQSYFKHDAESNLPEGYKKHLFDGRLNNSLMIAYCPKNCHGSLCLYQVSQLSNNYFVQVPHAVMKEGVEVITTHSIHNSLHSVGGIQMLLPLFAQIDMAHADRTPAIDYDICSTLLSVISLLLNTSSSAQQQLFHSRGFLIISSVLNQASKEHLTMRVLEAFIEMAKFLLTCPAGNPLLKQLFDHIFLNPQLWMRTLPEIQIRLYSYLTNEFLVNTNFSNMVRRTATVSELIHTIKTAYWVVPPRTPSSYSVKGLDDESRPATEDIVKIRGHILALINRLMFMGVPPSTSAVGADDSEFNRDEEFQLMLNFVGTVYEDDNLYDVLSLMMRSLYEHPAVVIPAFDRKRGISIVFKLLNSPNELIRIPSLKLFGYFLCRSTLKRKSDSVSQLNLLSLLTDRLLTNATHLSQATYNVLFEMLIERMTPDVSFNVPEFPSIEGFRFENPVLLKVIANLISQSQPHPEVLQVRTVFLQSIIRLCESSKENRRTILQMSVWQEWLINLSFAFPENEEEKRIAELCYRVFGILLYHAIRLEYGGWRVWVDTLAIAHSKVSREKFDRTQRTADKASAQASLEGSPAKNDEKPSAIYRTPEFVWSQVHLRLLDDLLSSIEEVVAGWKKDDPNNLMDHVNSSDSHIFVQNTVHVLSQLIDSLIMACGGLLPLLAAATSPNSELEIVDSTQQELSIEDAVHFLTRFANLADVFIFISGLNFSELEQEKNMPNGGILRQSLRLVSTVSVRNILACRIRAAENGEAPPVTINPRIAAIQRFVNGALESIDRSKGEIDIHRLLQEADLQRLKGIVYRDMEENRQAQFLALAVTYLLSVLMVSRYRDILEPPTSPSPFFNTSNGSNCSPSQQSLSASVDSGSADATSGSGEADPSEANGDREGEAQTEPASNGTTEVEVGISSIKVDARGASTSTAGEYRPDHLNRFNASTDLAKPVDSVERRAYLTAKLQNALESVAPLLREIMCDFKSFLQKTLLGTHSQEIMNDAKVMQTLKNPQGSVIELVMLLCSQEWQTSLQKHAGLAFIELVNEGRLMAHATRDHVLRVANEAEFILNRLRAEDVTKHSQFESESAEQLFQRKRDEFNTDHLLTSSRRRDALIASKMLEKMKTMLIGPSGAWSGASQEGEEGAQAFYKLDVWEDDSRRRKRFVPNPHGYRHSMAELNAAMTATTAEERQKARDDLLKELIDNKIINTFHLKTGSSLNELVDESDIDKWGEESDSETERTSYSTSGRLIAPGIVVPGTISITATDLYFDADEDDPLYQQQDPKCLRYCDNLHGRWHFQEIRAIFLRRYMLQNTALELFLSQRTAIMFAFNDQETVKKVVEHLPRVGVGVKYGLPQSRKTSLMTPRQLYKHSDMPQKWQKREISNFDYLMFLNTVAGRTFNDLNQYPIFPWVISNYTSDTLDLSQVSNFRDLSKPIGALSESRKKIFQDRFNNWEHDTIPPFHYGTHYSTQAFTLNWLLRVEPFTTMFLHMQSGRFDHSDRLFHNMAEVWENCQRDTQDVKELVPELFYMPELFRNDNSFELGVRENGERVNDVILPPWAKSPEHFVYLHRQALESDLVSCQLNQWIDLIFGYKQKGPEAVRAQNVFYYLTYEGAVNISTIENPTVREGIEQQILSFGQTPVQLLTEPHLPRHSIMTMSPMMFQTCKDDLCMLMKFISNSAIVHISANTFPQLANPTVLSVAQNLVFSLNRWNHNYSAINAANQSGSVNLSDKEGMSASPPDLPLTVDPLLAVGNPSQPLPKRHLGDSFDQRLPISWNNFVATVDSQFIMACGYPDYSFRVISTDNAQTKQVVYGHGDVVTCLARSEATLWADCYIASGSLDCTVVLWHWNSHTQCIAGEYNAPGETAAPRAILTGHDAQITAISVSAELGIVVSGSQDGVVLVHTTNGDLLRTITCEASVAQLPITNIVMSRECLLGVFYGQSHLATFTASGRQLQPQPYRFQEPINCTALSRDGEYLIVGSANGRISVLRLFPHQVLYTFQQLDSAIRCVALSVNQRFVLAGLDSGAIVAFNIDFNRWHFEYKQRYLLNQRRL